jgi:FixJ family two-component response regulator
VTSLEPIVYVVDDDPSVREALSSLIRSDALRVEAFTSAREFLRQRRGDNSACLVLDVRLPGVSGLDLQRELADAHDDIPIIFITGAGDIPMTVRAMKAGAVEFLQKPFHDQDLLDAVHLALARDRDRRIHTAALDAIRDRWESLTPRERAITQRIVQGLLNKQVAAELGLSEVTVKVHRRHIMEKMAASSLAELVRIVEKIG